MRRRKMKMLGLVFIIIINFKKTALIGIKIEKYSAEEICLKNSNFCYLASTLLIDK